MTARPGVGKYALLLLILFNLQMLAAPLHAAGVSWEQLSANEKNVLSHLKQHWNKYPAARQLKMQGWARQSPAQRALIKKRFNQWSTLSNARKDKIKEQLKRYKGMSPARRMKLKAWWRWVSRLPQHEQDKLNSKLPGMNKQQKRDYIRELEKKYGRR
jgi:replicative DNA helicase